MDAWLTKDYFGKQLAIHLYSPHKNKNTGEWLSYCKKPINKKDLPEGINPQWEDEKPIKIEIKLFKFDE